MAAAVVIAVAPAGANELPCLSDCSSGPDNECPTEQSEGNGLFVGMVSDQLFADPDPDHRRCILNTTADAGVRILRQSLRWNEIERSRGKYDFSWWDGYVEAVARHGIQVMPIIQDAPRWRTRHASSSSSWGLRPPKRAATANFAARLVRRYGPNGSFWTSHPDVPKVPIRVWQVWNEPNLPRYWYPRPNAADYVKLLWAVHNAIRWEDPGATIVTAGLPDSHLRHVVPLYRYIRQMYEAGARGAFDALAVNAYAERPAKMIANLGDVRAIMRSFGDRSKIWVTELGWGTGGPAYRFRVSRARQAEYVGKALRQLAAARFRLRIRGFVHYMWQDAPPYGDTPDFWGLHTGLFDMQGRTKPAYSVFRRVARQLRWIR